MPAVLGQRQRLLLFLAAWVLAGGLLGLLTHALVGAAWEAAAAFALPLSLVAMPIWLSASYLCRAVPLANTPPPRVALTVAAAALVTAIMWAALGTAWWSVLAGANLELSTTPGRGLAVLLVGFGADAYLLSVAVHYLIEAFEDAADADQRVLRSEIAARDAELRALRAQVDPHFLFNSLNAITSLIEPAPGRARAMGQLLADFLRESLTLGRAERISVEREVGLARRYLEIERARFGDRLTIATEVSAEAARVSVPPLLLQPLVENAVRHGIATLVAGGTVTVAARRSGESAVVVVTNPRDPDAGHVSGTGLGHDIVRRRLATAFGEDAALVCEAAGDVYRVTVTWPADAAARDAREED